MNENIDEPTQLTQSDIDKFVESILNSEIPEQKCATCGKVFYFESYGAHFCECDECFFSRFPKEYQEALFRSFFE